MLHRFYPLYAALTAEPKQDRQPHGYRIFLLTADELNIIALGYPLQPIIELMMQAIQENSGLTDGPLNQFMIVFRSADSMHWN